MREIGAHAAESAVILREERLGEPAAVLPASTVAERSGVAAVAILKETRFERQSAFDRGEGGSEGGNEGVIESSRVGGARALRKVASARRRGRLRKTTRVDASIEEIVRTRSTADMER